MLYQDTRNSKGSRNSGRDSIQGMGCIHGGGYNIAERASTRQDILHNDVPNDFHDGRGIRGMLSSICSSILPRS